MERRRARKRGRAPQPSPHAGGDPGLRIELLHIALVVGGVLVAVAGYGLLARGSISAAPALLILAYLLLIPLGLSLPARRRRPPEEGAGEG